MTMSAERDAGLHVRRLYAAAQRTFPNAGPSDRAALLSVRSLRQGERSNSCSRRTALAVARDVGGKDPRAGVIVERTHSGPQTVGSAKWWDRHSTSTTAFRKSRRAEKFAT